MASVRQLKNTKWQAQIRRAGHKPVTNTFINKSDAVMWARQIESEIDRGIFLDRTEAQRTSISELLERYAREVTPTKKSAAREMSRIKLLKIHFGHFLATQLMNKHVTEFRDRRLLEGRAGATVLKELNTLSHVIDVAIKEWGLAIPTNPVKLVRKPKMGRGRSRRLSEQEEVLLLEACRRSRSFMLGKVVIFAIETGMRLGEILSLKHDDVNLEKRVARLMETKNGDVRDVPLSSLAIKTILDVPRHHLDGRVFWAWKRVDSFEHVWRRAVDIAGLQDFRFHDLRHEATSRFFERGMSLMEVSSITGHRDLRMLRLYCNLRAEDIVKKLDSYPTTIDKCIRN